MLAFVRVKTSVLKVSLSLSSWLAYNLFETTISLDFTTDFMLQHSIIFSMMRDSGRHYWRLVFHDISKSKIKFYTTNIIYCPIITKRRYQLNFHSATFDNYCWYKGVRWSLVNDLNWFREQRDFTYIMCHWYIHWYETSIMHDRSLWVNS